MIGASSLSTSRECLSLTCMLGFLPILRDSQPHCAGGMLSNMSNFGKIINFETPRSESPVGLSFTSGTFRALCTDRCTYYS